MHRSLRLRSGQALRVVVFGGAGARGAQDDKSTSRNHGQENRIKKIKSESTSRVADGIAIHAIEVPAMIKKTSSCCVVRRTRVRSDLEEV